MGVIFRTDASVALGTGHLMRCATLAEALKNEGCDIAFICAAAPGNMNGWLRGKGFTVFEIPSPDQGPSENDPQDVDARHTLALLEKQTMPVDWLVVDHYQLDAAWERQMRPAARQIFIIDDLADRPHAGDCLLDQNYYETMQQRYTDLVPSHCQLLLGPEYALLRPEFSAVRQRHSKETDKPGTVHGMPEKTGNPCRLFVFFGGTDPTRETEKALEAVRRLQETVHTASGIKLEMDVVVGAGNPNRERIQTLCAQLPRTQFHCQIEHMATLMAQADIAIGAGGTTTWERLCVGLPSLVIAVADNQIQLSLDIAARGCEVYLGTSAEVSADRLFHQLQDFLDDAKLRENLRTAGMALVDGKGTQRIVQAMLSRATSQIT